MLELDHFYSAICRKHKSVERQLAVILSETGRRSQLTVTPGTSVGTEKYQTDLTFTRFIISTCPGTDLESAQFVHSKHRSVPRSNHARQCAHAQCECGITV